jgi:hypothetical protein
LSFLDVDMVPSALLRFFAVVVVDIVAVNVNMNG